MFTMWPTKDAGPAHPAGHQPQGNRLPVQKKAAVLVIGFADDVACRRTWAAVTDAIPSGHYWRFPTPATSASSKSRRRSTPGPEILADSL